MSIEIKGIIEYSEKENLWFPFLYVNNTFVKFNDEVNWKILGNPKDFKNDKVNSIAKNRGFPKNPSYALKNEINQIESYYQKYPKNAKEEIFGMTNFLYSEIENIDWKNELKSEKSEWFDLFKFIDNFIKLKQKNSKSIRFTLWYEW